MNTGLQITDLEVQDETCRIHGQKRRTLPLLNFMQFSFIWCGFPDAKNYIIILNLIIMYLISESEVRENLNYSELIDALEQAFVRISVGKAILQPRIRSSIGVITLNTLPSIIPDLGVAGIKAYLNNGKATTFQYMLFRISDPSPVASIEANYLGQIRTGALSALASRLLYRKRNPRLLVAGSGFQAESQLKAHLSAFEPEQTLVYSRDPEHAESFSRKMESSTGQSVRVEKDIATAVNDSDLICSATSAREPFLRGKYFRDEFHLNLVGSNILSRREADTSVFLKAESVIVESKEQAMLESAEIIELMKADPGSQLVELKDLVTARDEFSGKKRTIFKSMGNGIEDLVASYLVCRNMGLL